MKVSSIVDLIDFDNLHQKFFASEFPKPTTDNVPVGRSVRDDNGRSIASGFIKLFIEVILATDQSVNKRERIKAIDMLMVDLIEWSKENKIEQVHVFPHNYKFAEYLRKHYGFEDCKVKPLVLNL